MPDAISFYMGNRQIHPSFRSAFFGEASEPSANARKIGDWKSALRECDATIAGGRGRFFSSAHFL